MKKTILIFTAPILGIVACNEREVGTTNPQIDEEIQTAPPIYDEDIGDPDPNFCEGCGDSDFPADECYGNTCMQVPIGGEGCPVADINNMSENLDLESQLNLMVAYDHRDNFMIHTLKGQQYISHYSEIGHFIHDNNIMTTSNVSDFLEFGLQVYNKVDLLRNGSDNLIIVTSDFKTTALDLIELIREYDPPQYLSHRLDMIEHDLDLFEGMTRLEVLSYL